MMLFTKQNSRIFRVSCVPKPSQINTRSLLLAVAWFLDQTRVSYCRLM
jgi:hypothetical protein